MLTVLSRYGIFGPGQTWIADFFTLHWNTNLYFLPFMLSGFAYPLKQVSTTGLQYIPIGITLLVYSQILPL